MKSLLVLITAFFTLNLEGSYINGTVSDQDGNVLSGVNVTIKGTTNATTTDINGFYSIEASGPKAVLVFSYVGFNTQEIRVGERKLIDVSLSGATTLDEIVVNTKALARDKRALGYGFQSVVMDHMGGMQPRHESEYQNTEAYATIHENGFKKVLDEALSTFSIDVDAASYSNMRRFINNGKLPPKDAVRIEEMINYFTYDYKDPTGQTPFSINTELARAPWNEDHLIAHIGLQGKKIDMKDLPASNIVFLLDVSGSMGAPNKLPLLKAAFKLLVNELRSEDKVSIVVYAGAAGVVLAPTNGNNKKEIMDALDRLQAGGSTAGGAGINLAYKIAKEQFIVGGNNRVVLATDGDFNVGASSNASMERLIEEKRKDGIFLTALGFGMGNYKDSKMEILADKGNGNYAYIDTMKEAKKVLVNEFGGTLFMIAKDVKIQVEFNPALVQAYRLIGYENRLLNHEDFNDDKKDAGELGSGHTVTALYELIPVGVESAFVKDIDPLKYQTKSNQKAVSADELLTVKFRYKEPDGNTSKRLTQTVENKVGRASTNLNWSMAVAGFGMMLRDSEYKGGLSFKDVLQMAKASKGEDQYGYRAEFIALVDLARSMRGSQP